MNRARSASPTDQLLNPTVSIALEDLYLLENGGVKVRFKDAFYRSSYSSDDEASFVVVTK